MNKKGFTLIELLAVIVLLGIVLVITVPTVIGNVRNNKISVYILCLKNMLNGIIE